MEEELRKSNVSLAEKTLSKKERVHEFFFCVGFDYFSNLQCVFLFDCFCIMKYLFVSKNNIKRFLLSAGDKNARKAHCFEIKRHSITKILSKYC